MKNILFLSLAVIALIASPACKKSKSSNNSNEERLNVQTTPSTGTTDAPAPGPDFPLIVQVNSAMPPSGIKIQVTSKKDGSGEAAFFTYSQNSTSASNTITITGTPATTVCLVSITVTSLSDPGNAWNGTYRYSKK